MRSTELSSRNETFAEKAFRAVGRLRPSHYAPADNVSDNCDDKADEILVSSGRSVEKRKW